MREGTSGGLRQHPGFLRPTLEGDDFYRGHVRELTDRLFYIAGLLVDARAGPTVRSSDHPGPSA